MNRCLAMTAASVLAWTSLSLPAVAQDPDLTGRPVIIFIHGRDQMWETGSDLEARWFGAFEDGLEALAPDAQSEELFRALVPSTDRKLVRYERVYEPEFPISVQCGGVQPSRAGILAGAEFERAVTLEQFRQTLGMALPADDGREGSRAKAATERELGQLETASERLFEVQRSAEGAETASAAFSLRKILHAIRGAAGDMFGAGPGLAFTGDTRRYLEKGKHHCETNLRLRLALREATAMKRPIVLVAHSMGAMVSMDELWRSANADYNIVRFVSVGAQLGMSDLLRYLAGAGANRPLLPTSITSWVNIKGQNDLLGFVVNERDVQFAQGGPLVNKTVDTGPISRAHSISRYLQLRTTSHAIADAYCQAFPTGTAPAACSRISKFQ